MHVITGGAYNGKSAWVRQFYELEDESYCWRSAYKNDRWPTDLTKVTDKTIVLEGVEQWIFQQLDTFDREKGRKFIDGWVGWEHESSDRTFIVIGTDLSKGIVPMDPHLRKWRDVTGWFYQDLVAKCDRFDLIWYGISKRLK